ncbi:hypothetical protein AVEN_256430-1 [Araneus ventricosus]|uniref:Uncharacterized protein n=1 Tax=Araneus ventricosus TaxID=182803 RepID=A0A4Y2JZY0_ARAVE|nr:hypothetical protein AVEN_256430-1 [Araneus ventricosus]
MRSRRISKQSLASLIGTIMAWACMLPVIVPASYGPWPVMGSRSMACYCSDCHSDAPDGFEPGQGDPFSKLPPRGPMSTRMRNRRITKRILASGRGYNDDVWLLGPISDDG